MSSYIKGNSMTGSSKIWDNAVNTLLSAMESILLDEDLQSLWPREHHGQDSKKKHILPSTPTMPSSHDPTFSPPLKRKKDPLPPSDRSSKSQRMTDHLTARLATSLHVSSSMDAQTPIDTHQTGMENSRGFYRVQDQADSPPLYQLHFDPVGSASSEPRKYKKAVRNRSSPTTPVHSHPPSPAITPHNGTEDMFSSFSSTLNPFLYSHTPSGLAFETFASNATSPAIFLDPRRSNNPSILLTRRESRAAQQPLRSPAHHHLAMATRLALFHRILSTTKSTSAQAKDKEAWITEQMSKRGVQDLQSFEAAVELRAQGLESALQSLTEGVSRKTYPSFSPHLHQSQDQEIAIYTTIQTTVDTILETAQWLCGPDFDMGINRICPRWSAHEGSVEQIVHYVQVVESMRETLSDRFQHPQDISEDLTLSQEVIDYQRTLFGETLRNNGLEWRALGLPAMEELIQKTQDWILNLAKMLTIKIRSEVNFALESALHHKSTADPSEMDMMDAEDDNSMMGRSVGEVMDLVLQGALLSGSCLELAGKRCRMLVTAWMELTSQFCTYALAKRKEHITKASKTTYSQLRKLMNSSGSDVRKQQKQQQQHPHSGLSRGVFMKTMELFENVSRLLQCVMEMREEEEHDGQGLGLGLSGDGFGGSGEFEDSNTFFHGASASAASSDQDDAMEFVSASSSAVSLPYDLDQQSFQQHQQQRTPRSNFQHHHQRRLPVEPTLMQRWIAMESLASVLVETGLELCGSMAEILGCGHESASSANLPSTPTLSSGAFGGSNMLNSSMHSGALFGVASIPHDVRSGATVVSSSVRAAAAISSLTAFAGGGAMASGTGGVGLIYVQFVVRLMSKLIEFAGQDSSQEQRLLRIHTSLQNLELALSA